MCDGEMVQGDWVVYVCKGLWSVVLAICVALEDALHD